MTLQAVAKWTKTEVIESSSMGGLDYTPQGSVWESKAMMLISYGESWWDWETWKGC